MENQPLLDRESEDISHLPFLFLTLVGVVVLIGVGIFGGYVLGQNNNKDQTKPLISPSLSSELQLPDANTNANTTDSTNWTIYTDVSFSIKYPINWLVKKGFATKDDVVIYDPKTIKQVTHNGIQERLPANFVDILSVTASTQSAQQTINSYKSQASNSANLKSEESATLGVNQVLVDTGNASANTVLWSQNGLIAQFTTSVQHLTDTSIESKVLQSFQFIKQ